MVSKQYVLMMKLHTIKFNGFLNRSFVDIVLLPVLLLEGNLSFKCVFFHVSLLVVDNRISAVSKIYIVSFDNGVS